MKTFSRTTSWGERPNRLNSDFLTIFKNMVPPEEVLPNGISESECLVNDLTTQFARNTGQTIVFDTPHRSDSDGQCLLEQNPHPHCLACSCLQRDACVKSWSDHLGYALDTHSITHWKCPGENSVLIGGVCIDGQLIYIGKVVLQRHSKPAQTSLIRAVMLEMLKELSLTIQNRIMKHKLGNNDVSTPGNKQPNENAIQSVHPAVSQAVEYIKEHYRNTNLTLTSVADKVGISPCYLSDLFHATTGCTLHVYLRNVRRNNAEKLMKHTNMPLSDVARRSGFSSARSLRRALK